MNNLVKLSLNLINNTEFNDLSVEVCLDGQTYFDNQISTGGHRIGHEFVDISGSHVLEIKLKNKTFDHTQVDAQGNIIKDAIISIDNICIDDIKIDQLIWDLAKYTHNNNGTGDWAEHKFFGHMGCNGTLTFEFSTPFYLWLLENM